MGFEIGPTPLRTGRARWPALALGAVLALVVVFAVSTQTPAPVPTAPVPPAPSSPARGPVAQVGETPLPLAGVAVATPGPTRTLPPAVHCREVAGTTCESMARAALAVLAESSPAVKMVTVYRSLLCDDDQDCPPMRMASSMQPWGSVVVDFVGGRPEAWVNVVTVATVPQPGVPSAAYDAWIVR